MADETVSNTLDSPVTPPTAEVAPETPAPAPETPHPLEPGGKRFEQVYARMKAAEESKQREREARIAAEAKLDTLKQAGVAPTGQHKEKEFTWAELERAIENGNLTRAEALDYREKQIIRQTKAELTAEFKRESESQTRFQTIKTELTRYMDVVPDLTNLSSTLRDKVEREYSWLVGIHGEPNGELNKRAMELTAVKNVLGPVDAIEKRRATEKLTRENLETPMESNEATNRKPESSSDDENIPPKGLTPGQIAHYEKMFQKTNAYPKGWKSVREELAWKRPSLVRGGRP